MQGTIEVSRHSPLDLLQLINRPDLQCFDAKVITVGGTNGKGSCVSLLESICLAADLKVACYTSPHLLQFNERIRLNGQFISDDDLLAAFRQIDHARGDEVLNTFEFITLSALSIFKAFNADVILLEVGLGGRLDPVNCVDSDVEVITAVALDHIERLGGTREKIAKEKAGIFREGRPVILGESDMPTVLLDTAKALHCEMFIFGEDFAMRYEETLCHWQGPKSAYRNLPLTSLVPSNVACSLMVCDLLRAYFRITEAEIIKGLKTYYLPGRFEHLAENIIIDIAHNEQAITLLAQRLRKLSCKKTHALVGVAKDKLQGSIFSAMLDQIDEWHVAAFKNERSATAEALAEHLRGIGAGTVITYHSIADAYLNVSQLLAADECLIVFGSFFTVAEVLQIREE